jgi:hypothetical protein
MEGEAELGPGWGVLIPVELLSLLCYLQFDAVPFCMTVSFSPALFTLLCWATMAVCQTPWLTPIEVTVNVPRSLMFITPGALEVVLLFAGVCFSSFGDDESPLTAESTFEISCASEAIIVRCERSGDEVVTVGSVCLRWVSIARWSRS